MEKSNVQKRLARIEGQVAGIQKMIDGNRDCLDIVQQIAAVRSALAKVGVEVLKNGTTACTRNKKVEEMEKILDSIFRLS